jgi:hypothetical protein
MWDNFLRQPVPDLTMITGLGLYCAQDATTRALSLLNLDASKKSGQSMQPGA